MARPLLASACLLVAVAVLAGAPRAGATLGPCPTAEKQPTSCETLAVPLDRSGQVPGTVHLFVAVRAPHGSSNGALLVLTGGPGQAASPLIDGLETALAPALQNRELVVMDLRGTGRSDPLSCPQLDAAATLADEDRATTQCAQSLGAARGFYTSRDDADDIDAVRQSLGLDRIAIYGVSYGTYTAMTYARRYPSHVASLALDSVVSPDGRDPLDRSTYPAFTRILRDTCSAGCRGITRDPVVDLTRLAHRLERHALRASVYTPGGHRIVARFTAPLLVHVLEAGDLDPLARAEIPAAVRSALSRDGAPLARLLVRLGNTTGAAVPTVSASSTATFLATSCEEEPEPWSRDAPLSQRPAQAQATIAAVPASVYAPFSRAVELATGTSRACLAWPDASPVSPAIGGPLPDVPALVLAGVDDSRTPLADAQAAAALLPHAQLVPVPHTGHSVLGTDLGSCASDAIASFFSGQRAGACTPGPSFLPTPVAPRSFRGLPARGARGRRGRTITAVEATVGDGIEEALSYVLLGHPIAEGGLRGGRMSGSFRGGILTLRLSRLVYVPGVEVSGTVRLDLASGGSPAAVLHVGGRAPLHGTLLISGGSVVGQLSRRAVRTTASIRAAGLAAQRPSLAALLRAQRLAPLR